MLWPLAVRRVKRGKRASLRPVGRSMEPLIESGTRVTVEPVAPERLELGDIVMAEVAGQEMLHLVCAIDHDGMQVKIAGTSGPPNGWSPFECVFGIWTTIGGLTVESSLGKTRAPTPRRGNSRR